jgi:SNF2 family DNA or RNA helicase
VSFLHERTSLSPEGKGGGALLLDPGMGKSSIVLEFVKQMKDFGIANRWLVVAPLRVVYGVWPEQIQTWENFRSISYSIVHGSPATRRKRLALQTNLHIINREGIAWLAKLCEGRKTLPWQGIIIDESTSFKNWSAARSKALRKLIPRIPYRVIMTGTPAPKNLADLFGQMWLLDEGEALGHNVTRFRENYCSQVGDRNMNRYEVRSDLAATIQEKVKPLSLRLDAADYLSMPPIIYNPVKCEMPSKAMAEYKSMEEQLFLALADGSGREAVNAAAKYSACRQIANGGIYGDDRAMHHLHDAKTEACLEVIEELGGKPLMIAFQFSHDLERLKKAIKGLHVIQGGMKNADVQSIIDRWNTDTLDPPYLAVQPQAMSHGINAQKGSCRDVFWYGPSDSLETILQFNARVYRQGVGSAVRIHQAYCADTVDELVWARIGEKQDVQTNLLEVLREYAKRKTGLKPKA